MWVRCKSGKMANLDKARSVEVVDYSSGKKRNWAVVAYCSPEGVILAEGFINKDYAESFLNDLFSRVASSNRSAVLDAWKYFEEV